jgi:hypothetical protein
MADHCMRGAAVDVPSPLRDEEGAMGILIPPTIQEGGDQFHIPRLGEFLDSFDANAISFLDQMRAVLLQQTGDPTAARQSASQALEYLRQQRGSRLHVLIAGRRDSGAAIQGAKAPSRLDKDLTSV